MKPLTISTLTVSRGPAPSTVLLTGDPDAVAAIAGIDGGVFVVPAVAKGPPDPALDPTLAAPLIQQLTGTYRGSGLVIVRNENGAPISERQEWAIEIMLELGPAHMIRLVEERDALARELEQLRAARRADDAKIQELYRTTNNAIRGRDKAQDERDEFRRQVENLVNERDAEREKAIAADERAREAEARLRVGGSNA